MAKGGGSGGRGKDAAARRAQISPRSGGTVKKPGSATRSGRPTKKAVAFDARPTEEGESSAPRSLRLGLIPGATPGKWLDAWRERMPAVAVEISHLEVARQRDALVHGDVDLALIRLPIDRDDLSVIVLYDETAVVVCAADSALTAVDELTLNDLAGEVVFVPGDAVYDLDIPDALASAFDPPADTAQAIETVAAGVGVVIVPMSLARLHQRKDAAFRPLRDAPPSTVALAWRSDRTTPDVEAFIGVVRGRTANSSRA